MTDAISPISASTCSDADGCPSPRYFTGRERGRLPCSYRLFGLDRGSALYSWPREEEQVSLTLKCLSGIGVTG
jgi:hypothetical protein